jgi:hypothetical protein
MKQTVSGNGESVLLVEAPAARVVGPKLELQMNDPALSHCGSCPAFRMLQ